MRASGRSVIIGCALAVAACAPAALAQAAPDDAGAWRVAVTGGTLGVGPEVGYRFSDSVGVRANAMILTFSHSITPSDIRYDGKARLRSAGAMLDVFPFGGGFFVSGGARLNGNKGRVRATPTQPATIGGNTYTPAQIGIITGTGRVRTLAPALTLGWAGKRRPGFFVGGEAGVLFQGRIRIRRFETTSTLVSAADLAAERADVQRKVDDYKLYPIGQIVLGWRF